MRNEFLKSDKDWEFVVHFAVIGKNRNDKIQKMKILARDLRNKGWYILLNTLRNGATKYKIV